MRSDLIDIQVEDYGEDVETADAEKLAAAEQEAPAEDGEGRQPWTNMANGL